MGKKIKLTISGSGRDTDAPAVSDLLDQLGDYFDLLDLMELSIAEDGQSAIDWRIVNTSMSSPMTLTAEAFSKQFAVNVDHRASQVINTTTLGLRRLLSGHPSERPEHFTDEVLHKAKKILKRVTNGLETTTTAIGDRHIEIKLEPSVAWNGVRNIQGFLEPTFRPYKEIGNVEGSFQSVSVDGHGRYILHLKNRLTDDEVKCIVASDALKELKHCDIGDIWRKRRISVSGLIHYKGPLKISRVDATGIKFFKSQNELPGIDDIVDLNFTGGLRSEEHLERLRSGKFS